MFYIDTSAILPFYRTEASSDLVQEFFSIQNKPLLISYLTEVEFASALSRWVRMNEISEPSANKIESAFYEDIHHGLYRFSKLGNDEYRRAMQWLLLRKTNLRTLDALHLACAEVESATLITEDKNLIDSATFFGISVKTVKEIL